MQDKDFQLEQGWLDFVYENIDKQLAQEEEQTKRYRDNLQGMRTSLWEGTGSVAPVPIDDGCGSTDHRAAPPCHGFGVQHRLLQQLQMAEKAPYFGRMDFLKRACQARKPCIGIRSLMDQETNLALVYDWRAPFPVCL